MKINKTLTALIAGASIGMSGQAFSATEASQTITNEVVLSYKVGTVDQDDLKITASFKVDHKVQMTLVDNSAGGSLPPGGDVTFTYALANTGNKDQIFQLSLIDSANTNTTSSIATPSVTYVYKNHIDTAGDTITGSNSDAEFDGADNSYVTVAAGVTINYDATFTLPKQDLDGNDIIHNDSFKLIAKATAMDDTAGTVTAASDVATDKNDSLHLNATLVVHAEGASATTASDADDAYNGHFSIETTQTISSAKLIPSSGSSATGPGLTVIVINDPICNAFASGSTDPDAYYTNYSLNTVTPCAATTPPPPTNYVPKAIPGALVEYTITAYNDGGEDATDVVFTQDISDASTGDTILQGGTIGNISALTATSTDVTNDILTVNEGTIGTSTTVTVTFTAIVE